MKSYRSARRLAASIVVSALASMGALAQEGAPPPPAIDSQAVGTPVSVTLKTGEVLRGSFGGIADDKIVIDHPVLGKVTIPRAELAAGP